MGKSLTEVLRSRGAARVYLFTMCLMFSIPTAAQNWGQPVWSDEFSGAQGTPIDATKWTYDTGILNVNKEVEYYCAPPMTGGGCNPTNPNAYVDGNGHLVIQAIRRNASTTPNSGSGASPHAISAGPWAHFRRGFPRCACLRQAGRNRAQDDGLVMRSTKPGKPRAYVWHDVSGLYEKRTPPFVI